MTDYRSSASPRPYRRRSLLFTLLLPFVAFLLGLAAMAWILSTWKSASTYLGIAAPPQPQPATPSQPVPAAAATQSQLAPGDPQLIQRLTQLEQRIASIDNQSRQAVGNAGRAEGLLVAFAARRALDEGAQLGYIEGLLTQRFGQSQPQAVATIITASRRPVTLAELQLELEKAEPDLIGGSPGQNWWTAFRAELGDLITIRRQGTASTIPAERLKRASAQLQAGQVELALSEVLRMPGYPKAAAWVANARRYVAARNALDTIETAALLDPGPGGLAAPPAL
jgi:hypothetical protein